MQIIAKFAGVCRYCSNEYNVGDSIEWQKDRRGNGVALGHSACHEAELARRAEERAASAKAERQIESAARKLMKAGNVLTLPVLYANKTTVTVITSDSTTATVRDSLGRDHVIGMGLFLSLAKDQARAAADLAKRTDIPVYGSRWSDIKDYVSNKFAANTPE